MNNSYTNEELLELLRNKYKEIGDVYPRHLGKENNMPSYITYIKRFGNWNYAKRLAGISTNASRIYNITKDELVDIFKEIVDDIGHIPSYYELDKNDKFPSASIIYKHFNGYSEFITYCGFDSNKNGFKYKPDFLISELHRFVDEFGRIPITIDFENLEGYPSRKSFSNHFGSFNNALKAAGIEPSKMDKEMRNAKYTKEFLISEIHRYIDTYGHVPTSDEMDKLEGYPNRQYYRNAFKTWNNALEQAGVPLNSVSHHEDEFLKSEFERFVEKYERIPTYAEFNNSEYPSFWCYQNRFGSWNNAVMAYGYEPNDANRKFILEDGEICCSSYEFDISNYLKSKYICYVRDVNYKDFINTYKGKMNCDYVITYNNETWYVEMAGYVPNKNTKWESFSDKEKMYKRKLKYKIKLLNRQGLNYKIIYPSDMREKSLDDIFSFLFKQKEKVVI